MNKLLKQNKLLLLIASVVLPMLVAFGWWAKLRNAPINVPEDTLRSFPNITGNSGRQSRGLPSNKEDLVFLMGQASTRERKMIVWDASIQNGDFSLEMYQEFLLGMEAGPTRDALLMELARSAGTSQSIEFLNFLDNWNQGSSRTNAIAEYASKLRDSYVITRMLEWASGSEIPSDGKTVFRGLGPGINALQIAELISLSKNQKIGSGGRSLVAFAIGNNAGSSGKSLSQIREETPLKLSEKEWEIAEQIYWRNFPRNNPQETQIALEAGDVPAELQTEAALIVFNSYIRDSFEVAYGKSGELSSEKLRGQVLTHICRRWAANDLNQISEFALKLSEAGKDVPEPMVRAIVKNFIAIQDTEGAEAWKKLLPEN